MQQTCLNCGMSVSDAIPHCPKCDNDLSRQHDGSTLTVDIAHQGERVHEALAKMHGVIAQERGGVAQNVRLIVGSGPIRDEVLLVLRDLEFRGEVKGFETERSNAGSVVGRLK